jgi:hypothetical protein
MCLPWSCQNRQNHFRQFWQAWGRGIWRNSGYLTLLRFVRIFRRMTDSAKAKGELFKDHLLANGDARKLAGELHLAGVDLLAVLAGLTVYIEGRSLKSERQKHHREDAKVFNRGVRDNGVPPAVGRWLLTRSEQARNTNGWNRGRNVDALAWVHWYLELLAARRVTMTELCELVNGTYYALGRKTTTDALELGRELRRHRQKNEKFLEILKSDLQSKL